MSEPNLSLHQWFVSLGAAITLIASFLGYGTLIRRALRLPLPFIPVLGSAFASLIMAALGGGGLIHSLRGWPVLVVLLPGLLVAISRVCSFRSTLTALEISERGIGRAINTLVMLIVGVFLALRLFLASLPNMHPDALWYNLPAVRHWFQEGRFAFSPDAVVTAQASYWDLLSLWSCYFFPGNDLASYLSVQICAQLLTFVFGALGVGAIFCFHLRGWGEEESREGGISSERRWQWCVVAALAALSCNELLYTTSTAKSDYGAISWVLAGMVLAARGASLAPDTRASQEQVRELGIGGVFLGLAVGAKLSLLYVVVPFLALLLVQHGFRRGAPLLLRLLLLGMALPLGAFFLRNLLWTGNPLFPSMSTIFPSPYISETWLKAMSRYDTPAFERDALLHRISNLFPRTNPLTLFFLLPLSFGFRSPRSLCHEAQATTSRRSHLENSSSDDVERRSVPSRLSTSRREGESEGGSRTRISTYFTFMSHAPRLFPHHLINRGVLLGVVLFLAFAGSWAETRLIGVCGLIICAEAIRNVATLFERSRWRDGVLVLAVVGVSANAFFLTAAEVRERGREDKGGRGFSVLRDWVGESPGGAPFRHPPERVGRLAVSLEPRMYFLAPFQAVRLGDSPRLDRELSAHQTPHAHATVLCREGFSSLLLSNYSFDFFYNTKVALSLQELPKLYPEAIIEAAPVETLMDLKKICSQH